MKKIVLEEQAIRLIQQLSERKLQQAIEFLITLGKAGNSDRPTKGSKPLTGLGTAMHNTFAPIGGVELEIPKREPIRELPFQNVIY